MLTVAAPDPSDVRTVDVEVAGLAAMLVTKAHKIRDRVVRGRADRLSDEDAADVVRIMQTSAPRNLGATLVELRVDASAGAATDLALTFLSDLFGRRAAEGVAMAQRALRLAMLAAAVATLYIAFTERLVEATHL